MPRQLHIYKDYSKNISSVHYNIEIVHQSTYLYNTLCLFIQLERYMYVCIANNILTMYMHRINHNFYKILYVHKKVWFTH